MRRTLVVLVEIDVSDDQPGMPLFAAALRGYCAAVENGVAGHRDVEHVEVCGDSVAQVKVVHGVDE